MLIVKEETVGLLRTHCWMFYNSETMEGFLVDPGYSEDRILKMVSGSGVKIVGILLTHAHFDHTMALSAVRESLQVPVYAGEKEEEMCLRPELNLSARYAHQPVSFTCERFLKDGEVFELAGFSVRVLETPGHTAGSVCYYIENEKTLISGDTLFFETYGVTSHPTGSQAEIICSVEHLLETLPDDVQVYPGHGETTTIAYEKDVNPARMQYRMMKGL